MRLPQAASARPRRLLKSVAPSLALALLALAGCGSSSSSSSTSAPAATTPAPAATTPAATGSSAQTTTTPASGGTSASQTLALAAGPGAALKFSTTTLSAKAGAVTINYTNESPVDHNLTIASSSGAVAGATPTFHGGSKPLSLTLKAGTYKFYCSVPGHREAGMEGTLTVQ